MILLISSFSCYDADDGSGIMIVLMSIVVLGALAEQVLYYKKNYKRIIHKKRFVRRMRRMQGKKKNAVSNAEQKNEQPLENVTYIKNIK